MGDAETPETTPAAEVAQVDFFSEKARPFDPDVAARVLRKIDLFLMPAMVIGNVKSTLTHRTGPIDKHATGYGLVYWDKVSPARYVAHL